MPRRDAIVDPARVGASVRAQGGSGRDVAEALTFAAFLRMAGPARLGDDVEPFDLQPVELPEPVRAWACGARGPLTDEEWLELHCVDRGD